MSEENILNEYVKLINKGYCSDCKELNCIDNFPHKKIVKAIEHLQQENQRLKQQNINKDTRNSRQRVANAKLIKENKELKDKIKIKDSISSNSIKDLYQYATILTGFEKWLDEEIKKLKQSQQEIINLNISNISKATNIREFNLKITANLICFEKLQELKESKK